MTERIRHTFVCQNCGSKNTCDLTNKIDQLGVSCSGCSENGKAVKGDWELEKRETVVLDSNFGPVGEAARQAIEEARLG